MNSLISAKNRRSIYLSTNHKLFSGRFKERDGINDILGDAAHKGQTIMVSGARGSGKTSFLKWIELPFHADPMQIPFYQKLVAMRNIPQSAKNEQQMHSQRFESFDFKCIPMILLTKSGMGYLFSFAAFFSFSYI